MPSRALAAFAATYAATPLPGTPGTPGDLPRGSGLDTQKTAENSGVPGHGTPRTPGTPKNGGAGVTRAIHIQPDRDAPAIAPSDGMADGRTAALAAPVAALRAEPADMTGVLPHWPPGSWRKRRYAADTPGDLWTTMQTPVSWADPAARPTAGAWCGNCENATWARDKRRADGGWVCSVCHPPDNVPIEHRDVVRW